MRSSSGTARRTDDGESMFARIRGAILKIPRGKVATYGEVALGAGFPGAARQVVWALRQSHGLPWHRVLAAGGRIALSGEAGFEQRLRLEAEGVQFNGRRVNMNVHEFTFAKELPASQYRVKPRLDRAGNKPKRRTQAKKRK
jgi:methylated-DNA-protein-cysteine methyltransferase related protein